MMQRISDDGLDAVKEHEGLRLRAYLDPVGLWTIGYGHTRNVKEGDEITAGEAHDYLVDDVRIAESCVRCMVKVPLTQGQFDALVSFVFNLGCYSLQRSTLLACLNNNEYARAAAEFVHWNKAGGRVLRGLETRRAAEQRMFTRREEA